MGMRVILARRTPMAYRFVVHLDDSRRTQDGAPDPAWTAEWTWGLEPPDGQSREDYEAAIRRELRLLAQAELARRRPPSAGVPLIDEGSSL